MAQIALNIIGIEAGGAGGGAMTPPRLRAGASSRKKCFGIVSLTNPTGLSAQHYPRKMNGPSLGRPRQLMKPFPALAHAVFVTDHSHTASGNRSDLFTKRARAAVPSLPLLKLPEQWP